MDFSTEEQYTDEIPEGNRQIATPGVQGERQSRLVSIVPTDKKSTAKSCPMKKPWLQ
ncbi:hypothetical protein HGP05_10050 [Streptococcus sanguinis]|uniref:G5 domain-containing protein n=1 Tax=Streptococcus sanguinis TaxID=1305 RepID=A0A7Y0VBI7_STRSA|nr:hypothetical protein [Streptococcus sanguinis]